MTIVCRYGAEEPDRGDGMWSGWIYGAPKEYFESLGIVITEALEHGEFNCQMTEETRKAIEHRFGEFIWGLSWKPTLGVDQ